MKLRIPDSGQRRKVDTDDPVVRGEHLQAPREEELHEGSHDRLDEMEGGLTVRNEGNVQASLRSGDLTVVTESKRRMRDTRLSGCVQSMEWEPHT